METEEVLLARITLKSGKLGIFLTDDANKLEVCYFLQCWLAHFEESYIKGFEEVDDK